MKILITGAKGMLAKAVIKKFEPGNELILTDVDELDITNAENVLKVISINKPDVVINCAAYTAVDKAEEEIELARKINANGPKNLALACKKCGTILVHISTDYVFKGNLDSEKCYSESDETFPETVYGMTKLEGEKNIISNCNKYYIFRTAWLYGDGKNFVKTMIKAGKNNNSVKVVNDQFGSPTYTEDLADTIYQALTKKISYGIYHITNLGFTTWYKFTKEIYKIANINCDIIPVTSEEFITIAKRPKNSKLSKEKILSKGIKIPHYRESLKKYLKKEGEIR